MTWTIKGQPKESFPGERGEDGAACASPARFSQAGCRAMRWLVSGRSRRLQTLTQDCWVRDIEIHPRSLTSGLLSFLLPWPVLAAKNPLPPLSPHGSLITQASRSDQSTQLLQDPPGKGPGRREKDHGRWEGAPLYFSSDERKQVCCGLSLKSPPEFLGAGHSQGGSGTD